MLEIKKGNIFSSETKALVNPVNTEGIMGKGLAFQFKKNFPKNYENYLNKCKKGEFFIGSDLIYTFENNKIIINFPTKQKWRENSKIEYIKIGLEKLKELIKKENISSISIPPLGAGNGKLEWEDVKKLLIEFSRKLDQQTKVIIYEPTQHEFSLVKTHLLLTKVLIKSYEMGITKRELTDITLQKIVYLGDKNNYFKFEKYKKGPFSKLINITYNQLKIYCKLTSTKLREIEFEVDKRNISNNLKMEEKNISDGISLYLDMKKYYNYSIDDIKNIEKTLELLTTVLFIFSEDKSTKNIEKVYQSVITWNDLKKKKYCYEDVVKMIDFLSYKNIVSKNIFNEYELN